MLSLKSFITEALEADGKLKHIHHAEDRPLLHGSSGLEHAYGALNQAHTHMKVGQRTSNLTMKYDGSPSIVFGHHPRSGQFFVASKSAFNKTPKINYSHEDIDKNHGHAPGLAAKLHIALDHLHKITPKKGVYQGDLMYHTGDKGDLTQHKEGHVSFTPNTITYTAHGDAAKKISRSKIGVVIHTKYKGDDISNMTATHKVDHENFKTHPDVFHHTAEHDLGKVQYSKEGEAEFKKHMTAAKSIHDTHGQKMYNATAKHQGDGGHLATYINSTVRKDEIPHVEGLKSHIQSHYEKAISKLKTDKSKQNKLSELKGHIEHIDKNKSHYQNLLTMHHHLQQAKNVLVNHLEQHEGQYGHYINGKPSKPEGFVIHHENEPTKLVNRAEFAKQNLLKVRK